VNIAGRRGGEREREEDRGGKPYDFSIFLRSTRKGRKGGRKREEKKDAARSCLRHDPGDMGNAMRKKKKKKKKENDVIDCLLHITT